MLCTYSVVIEFSLFQWNKLSGACFFSILPRVGEMIEVNDFMHEK